MMNKNTSNLWVHIISDNYKQKKTRTKSQLSVFISWFLTWTIGVKSSCINRWRKTQQQWHFLYLSVLLQVVVQNLRVGLLVRGQDVHEGGRGVGSGSRGVDGTPAPQSWRQAERSCRRASVETLLIERLQGEGRQRQDMTSLFNSNCMEGGKSCFLWEWASNIYDL